MTDPAAKGYYSLIQYCPDLGRFEAANIGVLLFCPDRGFLDASLARDNRRVEKFFGKGTLDKARLNQLKAGILERVRRENFRSVNELQSFIAQRANAIQLTPPLPIRVTNPQVALEDLFDKLVKTDPSSSTQRTPVKEIVSERFIEGGVDDLIERNVAVTIPVVETEVEFPFAYQNGRRHFIAAERFITKRPDLLQKTASNLAVEGDLLSRANVKLIVVGEFGATASVEEQRVRRVLRNYEVELFCLRELPELIREIRDTATPVKASSHVE